MPNPGKVYSTRKENEVKHILEEEGYYVIRAAGSKGAADLVAIKPHEVHPAWDVRFIQIKTSRRLKKEGKRSVMTKILPQGFWILLEFFRFPVRRYTKTTGAIDKTNKLL